MRLILETWRYMLSPGRVLNLCWVIWMCRRFDPLFWHSGDWTQAFWGTFSHPPISKRSFGVLKLPILTDFDLFYPKFPFSLDLLGSNFQWPAAHPHRFSDRIPPPPGCYLCCVCLILGNRGRQCYRIPILMLSHPCLRKLILPHHREIFDGWFPAI